MSEANLSQEMRLFAAAVEMGTDAERAAYLEGACAGDAQLRANVEDLIAIHFGAPGFLPIPDSRDSARRIGGSGGGELAPGRMIDRYELVERIGGGGMGEVWRARQFEPLERTVALKVIKLGMDTEQIVARFEAERQALARMDHPNIAQI